MPIIIDPRDEECLKVIKKKIEGQICLEECQTFLDDEFLLRFIRGRKYNVDYAFETIKHYFHVRLEKYPDIFLSLMPSKIKLAREHCVMPLKHLGTSGNLIMFSKIEWWPSMERMRNEGILFQDGLHKLLMIFEEMWKLPDVSLRGFEALFDVSGVTFEQVMWAITQVKYYLVAINIGHKGMPLRIKKIHLVNPPSYVNILLKILKPLDPGYLKKLHIHQGKKLETLHEHIPKEILPYSLSGDISESEAFDEDFLLKTLQNDKIYEKLHLCIKKRGLNV